MRLFFGLELPGAVKTKLLKIKSPLTGARWQNAAQLHLTLAFLGNVNEQNVALAKEKAREIVWPEFALEVRGLGCFGAMEHPQILWAGVSPETELTELQQTLATRLTSGGFTLQNPSFKPHITISRFRAGAGSVADLIEQHRGTCFGRWTVREFVLFESTPRPQGSVYTVLERYPLGAQ